MSAIIVKCPHCDFEFTSAFQDDEDIEGINTPCMKCASPFEIAKNQKKSICRN